MIQPLRKTHFTIDDGHLFEGYTAGETWNGWEQSARFHGYGTK